MERDIVISEVCVCGRRVVSCRFCCKGDMGPGKGLVWGVSSVLLSQPTPGCLSQDIFWKRLLRAWFENRRE